MCQTHTVKEFWLFLKRLISIIKFYMFTVLTIQKKVNENKIY